MYVQEGITSYFVARVCDHQPWRYCFLRDYGHHARIHVPDHNTNCPVVYCPTVQRHCDTANQPEPQLLYRSGLRDLPSLFFYALTWIAVHCALQEYFLDKIQRRLHLSKTRQTKFNESGQLFAFRHHPAVDWLPRAPPTLLTQHKTVLHFPDYLLDPPVPEFYFQKLKRDEIRSRTIYSILFFGFTSLAYFANFNRLGLALLSLEYFSQTIFHFSRLLYFTGKIKHASTAFKPWNVIFVLIRFATVLVSVLTLWYGLRSHETPFIDIVNGNWNTHIVRLNTLLVIVLVQLYMLFNFSTFHFSRFRERSKGVQSVSSKNKAAKKDKKVKMMRTTPPATRVLLQTPKA
uniref:TLC domain-containing protein n=1 Tax=Ditylenchus dipsaci TaxID=166011 RepID=A0A915D0T0_9BILA